MRSRNNKQETDDHARSSNNQMAPISSQIECELSRALRAGEYNSLLWSLVYKFSAKASLYRIALDDLFQEVMLKVWQASSDYSPQKSKPTTWITRVAKNRLLTILDSYAGRQKRYSGSPDLSLTPPTDDEGRQIEQGAVENSYTPDPSNRIEVEAIMEVSKFLLTEDQYNVINKHYIQEWTLAEIAREAKTSHQAIGQKFRRAIQILKSELNNEGEKILSKGQGPKPGRPKLSERSELCKTFKEQ